MRNLIVMGNRLFSIVIPAYNEGQRLAPTLDQILAHCDAENWNVEIVVVNDGSTDNTVQVVEQYARLHPSVRLVNNPGNRGKGYAVKNGMLHARGDIMLMTDADLSSPIAEASKLFYAIDAGADVAIGSRWIDPSLQTRRQGLVRQLGGRAINLAIRMILGLPQKDTQCGFKAFSRGAAQKLFPLQLVERWGFDPELLYLAKRFEMKTAEVGVLWANDERSKLHPFRDGMRLLQDAVQVRVNAMEGKYNPVNAAPEAVAANTKIA